MRWLAIALWVVVVAILATTAHAATGKQASCPGAVTWNVAMKSVGKTITLRGKVTSAHYAKWKSGKGSMTFLDFGNRYPVPNRFTVIVWNKDDGAFDGKTICVRGTVDKYEGVPEMQQVTSIKVIG